jgi:hypothetical protein
MRPSCPRCCKSGFTYGALLALHPYPGEFSPTKITCPTCGEVLRVTAKSRLLAAAAIVSILPLLAVAVAIFPSPLHEWQLVLLVLSLLAGYYFGLWPLAVRLKPWSEFQYWLPKSRPVGYSVYLLFPVSLIVLFLYLGIRWGA